MIPDLATLATLYAVTFSAEEAATIGGAVASYLAEKPEDPVALALPAALQAMAEGPRSAYARLLAANLTAELEGAGLPLMAYYAPARVVGGAETPPRLLLRFRLP